MTGAARNFFILALLYGIAGMLLGLYMGLSQDHSQMPVHAHAMVLGWLMSGFFAFFYHLFPAIGQSRLATVHFWLTAASGIVILVSLFFVLSGNIALEPVTGISSMVFFACFLLFVWIARPAFSRAG
jgi:cbb3-type cytochrome oxidase subunit 1